MLDTLKRGLSNLFGKDTTSADRKKAVSLDLITSDLDNIPEGALAALWELHDSRMQRTPQLIRQARMAMNGEIRGAMAPEWDAQDREDFDAGGPEAYVRPRETAKRLASKKARIARPIDKFGPEHQKKSTRIEQWAGAILDDQFADYPTTEMLLNESMTLWICQPAASHWQTIPTLYDEFEEEGEHADQDEYDALPESRRREYERANSDEDSPRYKRMRKQYRRNEKGDPDDGADDFETDHKQTAKAFRTEMEDLYARNVPVLLRGPISRLDFVPINPRFSGKKTIVDGVIIRTLYRQSTLAREYAWAGCEQLLEPVDRYDGADGDFYLYELWANDHLDRPFCAYQVGKHGTRYANDGSTAVVKFWEEYPGITELTISVEYGQHTADTNADRRGLPFPIPYIRNWKQRDVLLTALVISVAQSGYPTWGQKITKEAIETLEALEGDYDLEFRMRSNTVQPIFGDIVELTSKGTNQDVKILLEALDALNEKELPSKGAFGGEGPTSGVDRQVMGRDMEIAYSDVIEGYRRTKEAMGRYALMVGSAIGRKADRPVELYQIGTAPNPETGGTAKTRTKLTLPPDLCGGNWDVVAQFETEPGEKLAQSSLFLSALSQGAILLREWREWGVGDQNPEQFMWEKMLEDFYLKDPAGRLAVYRGMLDYVSDQKTKELLELAHQGEITNPQGGVPTGVMDDMLGGEQGMGMMGTGVPDTTGMGQGLPNPGQQSLAGANAGAIQASAAGAGGPFDGGGVPV